METEQLEQPGYYAVIPANVRYSSIPNKRKTTIRRNYSSVQQRGFCWASDEYFGNYTGQQEKQSIGG